MRHKWKNPHGLEYHYNDGKSQCENCGLIRLRSSCRALPQVYYFPYDLGIRLKAPKCELKQSLPF